MKNMDGSARVLVEGHTNEEMPFESIFSYVDEASDFFKAGSLGYSPAARPKQYDGMELRVLNWQVEPLSVTRVESSYFENRAVFPEGSVTFDNALLMRGIDHEWHGRESLCCATE
jgi:hypothetical protein